MDNNHLKTLILIKIHLEENSIKLIVLQIKLIISTVIMQDKDKIMKIRGIIGIIKWHKTINRVDRRIIR
jgi:hypothetical protein